MPWIAPTYTCTCCGHHAWGQPAYRRKVGDVVIRLCAACEAWRQGGRR